MAQVTANKIHDFNKLCDNIKNLDSKIRFAGIVNERGRLVAGGMKEGIEPFENLKDAEVLYMELALRVKMRKEFDKQLGCVKFAMALREKGLAMSFPINDYILYIFAEPKADYKKLPDKIIKLIDI